MKYWVVINNERRGPMTLDELKSISELTADSYVWHEELPEWTHAGNLEELKTLFEQSESTEPQAESTETAKTTPQTIESSATSASATADKKTWYDYGSMPDMSACPPTFLVFSIIMLLCCCQVTGIIAVVYSSQVRSLYLSNQVEKAERYSRNAFIWCVVSLLAGILSVPLYILWSIYSVVLG